LEDKEKDRINQEKVALEEEKEDITKKMSASM